MTREFTIYHGHASPTDLEACKGACPTVTHGVEWSDPDRMVTSRDEPFIIDNGAYGSEGFVPSKFIRMLDAVSQFSADPDFVILPDCFDNWEKTQERAIGWYETVAGYGYDYYVVGQPPAGRTELTYLADRVNASGIFLGGSRKGWKLDMAEKIDSYPVHIGNPELGSNLRYASKVADSVDTTSIVVNDLYQHLTQLEADIRDKREQKRI